MALPHDDFFIGHVHSMCQALDLNQMELDLRTSEGVVLDLYDQFWPDVIDHISSRLGSQVRTISVCMSAIDPGDIFSLPEADRADFIEGSVRRILEVRGKNLPQDIEVRATSAVREILDAFGPHRARKYELLLHSAAEGPDGKDEWTQYDHPVGQAEAAFDQFMALLARVVGESIRTERDGD